MLAVRKTAVGFHTPMRTPSQHNPCSHKLLTPQQFLKCIHSLHPLHRTEIDLWWATFWKTGQNQCLGFPQPRQWPIKSGASIPRYAGPNAKIDSGLAATDRNCDVNRVNPVSWDCCYSFALLIVRKTFLVISYPAML